MAITLTNADLIDLYLERVAIRIEATGDVLEYKFGGDESAHEQWCYEQAYWDLRRLVGDKVKMPEEVQRKCRKFR